MIPTSRNEAVALLAQFGEDPMELGLGCGGTNPPVLRAQRFVRPICALVLAVLLMVPAAKAIDASVPRINGDKARALFGPGTGVVIGVVDSGVDWTHPALAGNDSQGMPRLVASGNFVPTEPNSNGEDLAGRGTAVAGVALSSDGAYTGLAPDARYVNARALDANGAY